PSHVSSDCPEPSHVLSDRPESSHMMSASVMAITIFSMWAAHYTLEVTSVHKSAPEVTFVHESAPEITSDLKPAMSPIWSCPTVRSPPDVTLTQLSHFDTPDYIPHQSLHLIRDQSAAL
ncbi:hypothetical protein M9458_036546, partial [Cirrhinus mrigala]